jgi:hypothetical protein
MLLSAPSWSRFNMAKSLRRQRRATDHRAIVLEAVATCPTDASMDAIVRDAIGPDFIRKNVQTMVYQLRKEGLLGLKEDGRTHYITELGLEWLTYGRFDQALPGFHERPASRKSRKRGS